MSVRIRADWARGISIWVTKIKCPAVSDYSILEMIY